MSRSIPVPPTASAGAGPNGWPSGAVLSDSDAARRTVSRATRPDQWRSEVLANHGREGEGEATGSVLERLIELRNYEIRN